MPPSDSRLPNNSTRTVVFAYGNPSRGDDALGPALLRRLTKDVACRSEIGSWIGVTDFQLQIEHAHDLMNRDLALFIDASISSPTPFSFFRLAPWRDISYTSHAMSAAAVLYGFEQAYGRTPPPAYMLSIRGENFALGDPMSTAARNHLAAAFEFAKRLILHPDSECWNARTESFRQHSD